MIRMLKILKIHKGKLTVRVQNQSYKVLFAREIILQKTAR
jgi:hypothetical protein